MKILNLATGAIAAGFSVNAVASERTNDPLLDINLFESDANHLSMTSTGTGFVSEGGLLGTGLCCADCREQDPPK